MPNRLIVIDSNVYLYQTLLESLEPDSEVLMLDSSQDGLQQIADYLGGSASAYDSLHIVSHGSAATLSLGSTTLSLSNIDSYSALLGQIGLSLTDTGDILLYGCDVASGTVQADTKFRTSSYGN